MERMGYGDQPYVIYKHTDIARAHLHIVSSRIRPDRTPVNDKNWKLKSKSITDEMERLFRLHPKGREQAPFDELRQIDYAAGNLKTQIASVALNLIGRYNFARSTNTTRFWSNSTCRSKRVKAKSKAANMQVSYTALWIGTGNVSARRSRPAA